MADEPEEITFLFEGEELSGVVLDRYYDADGVEQILIQLEDGRKFQIVLAELEEV